MEKIIVAIDGLKYAESAVQYSVQLAQQSKAHLVGVLLDDITHHSYKAHELMGAGGSSEKILERLEETDQEMRKKASNAFETACQRASIDYSIHHRRYIALHELLHETIFADLLVVSRGETFTKYREKLPTRFIRDLLAEAQCPVLVVPENYKPIEKISFLYDGQSSSVYAIKMFSYIFPFLLHLPSEVISINNFGESLHLKDINLMKEFMKRHFPDASYTVLKGLAETQIINQLRDRENNVIILGAYNRGMVSRWLMQSMADTLMEELKAPLFIAHSK